jgi:photosystem II stability/assembly factor-like uncharacterized protein
MLLHFLGAADPKARWSTALMGALALSCSFYTDCPCANQPAKPVDPTGAGGSAGAGASGGATTGGLGGSGTGDAGEGGAGGTMIDPGVWIPASGDLAGKSTACGNVTFMSAKPDGSLLIAAIAEDGLWGSRDGGESWDALGSGSRSALVSNITTSIVYDPKASDTFWEVGIYGPGVFRTDDDGENFSPLGTIIHNDYLAVDFTDPKRQLLLAGGHEQAQVLHRSLDGGENWEDVGAAIPEECKWSSFPLILDANTFLLGCWNGILRSSDGGESWDILASYGGANVPLVTSSGLMFWNIDVADGLVRSSDGGETWERVVGGGVISNVTPIELPDGSLATTGSNMVLRSTDDGESWEALTPAAPFTPRGVVYSREEQAFFVWQSTCEPEIPENAILRFDYAI